MVVYSFITETISFSYSNFETVLVFSRLVLEFLPPTAVESSLRAITPASRKPLLARSGHAVGLSKLRAAQPDGDGTVRQVLHGQDTVFDASALEAQTLL